MKTLIVLLGFTVALASSSGVKINELNEEHESDYEFQTPERHAHVITKFPEPNDYSKLSMDELIKIASKHQGLEFLADANATAGMGIDFLNLHSDLIADAFGTTITFVERRNYPIENHTLHTSDQYILEMHRITGSPKSPPRKGKIPVYLQHGLLDSSAGWVIMGVNHSLAFLLADLGYDVWLGNVRGNRYSRKHLKYNPDGGRFHRRRFWNFSWHEMGIIDLPEMIDYITRVTKHKRMHYVGHSQGTTAFFVMCSMRPEYNDRILSAHMLAPIAFMRQLNSPLVQVASLFQNTISIATIITGIFEFLPNRGLLARLGQSACRAEILSRLICKNVLFLIGGFNSAQLNRTMLTVILKHIPAGASTNNLVHYAQGIRWGKFRQFSFGPRKNIIKYGSFRAPSYKLKNIRAPMTLYYSENDWLAHVLDVERLIKGMSGRPKKILIADPRFNHFDFLWAVDVKSKLYDQLIDIMKAHD